MHRTTPRSAIKHATWRNSSDCNSNSRIPRSAVQTVCGSIPMNPADTIGAESMIFVSILTRRSIMESHAEKPAVIFVKNKEK